MKRLSYEAESMKLRIRKPLTGKVPRNNNLKRRLSLKFKLFILTVSGTHRSVIKIHTTSGEFYPFCMRIGFELHYIRLNFSQKTYMTKDHIFKFNICISKSGFQV